jgi:hypothetical protein
MTTYKTKTEARIAAKKQEQEWESKEWNLYFWLWVATIAGKNENIKYANNPKNCKTMKTIIMPNKYKTCK